MRRIPHILLLTRLVLGPVLLALGLARGPGWVLFAILVLATLTDAFDGILARRVGTATPWLRRADSFVDMVFYIFAGILVVFRYPQALRSYWPGIAAVVLLEIVHALFDHVKFGRQAAYHMWSAKIWGLALLFGFSEVFLTGRAGVLFAVAVAAGMVTDTEGLVASFILPEWRHDVPSIVHAVRIRRAWAGRGTIP
ncbi:MAG: CDP-alcohol phosphatidyltransferase family protein [Acidobacteriota bacterium]